MALQPNIITIPLSVGMDTKRDSKGVPIGTMQYVANAIFTTGNSLKKRPGYRLIGSGTFDNSVVSSSIGVANYDNELLCFDGDNLLTYSPAHDKWAYRGRQVSTIAQTIPLIADGAQNVRPDHTVTTNGIELHVWHDETKPYNGIPNCYEAFYEIIDGATRAVLFGPSSLNTRVAAYKPCNFGDKLRVIWFDENYRTIVTTFEPVGGTFRADTVINTGRFNGQSLDYTVSGSVMYLFQSSPGTATEAGLYGTALDTNLSTLHTYSGSANMIRQTGIAVSEIRYYDGLGNLSSSIGVTYIATGSNLQLTVFDTSLTPISTSALNVDFPTVTFPTYNGATTTRTQISTKQHQNLDWVCLVQADVLSSSVGGSFQFQNVEKYTLPLDIFSVPLPAPSVRVVRPNAGLSAKIFADDQDRFFFGATYSPFINGVKSLQSTEFLCSEDGTIIGQYMQNLSTGLPALAGNQPVLLPEVHNVSGSAQWTSGEQGQLIIEGGTILTEKKTVLNKSQPVQNGNGVVNIAQSAHIAGGALAQYDGKSLVEHGFFVYPEVPGNNQTAQITYASGSVASGSYLYAFTYEWTDNKGLIHRSAPSQYQTIHVPLPTTGGMYYGTNPTFPTVLSILDPSPTIGIGTTLVAFPPHDINNWPHDQIQVGDPQRSGEVTLQSVVSSPTPVTINGEQHTWSSWYCTTNVTASIPDITLKDVLFDKSMLTARVDFDVMSLQHTRKQNVRVVGYRSQELSSSVAASTILQRFTDAISPTLNVSSSITTRVSDSSTDEQIASNDVLYTCSGELATGAAPHSTALAIYKNRLFTAGTDIDVSRIPYSKLVSPGIPVEFAPELYIQLSSFGGKITGLQTLDDKLIIFKEKAIYVLSGEGPDNRGQGGDYGEPQLLPSDVGCVDARSIVTIPAGIMFKSAKGIYMLDRGMNTSYVGAPAELFNSSVIVGAQAIPGTNRVMFNIKDNYSLIYDTYAQQWAAHGSTTLLSRSGATIWKDNHTVSTVSGSVYVEDSTQLADGQEVYEYGFETGWITPEQNDQRLWAIWLLGTFDSQDSGNFDLVVRFLYDYVETIVESITVPVNNVVAAGGFYPNGATMPAHFGIRPSRQKCNAFKVIISTINSINHGAGDMQLNSLCVMYGNNGKPKLPSTNKFGGS
jgi:hypothetical protein